MKFSKNNVGPNSSENFGKMSLSELETPNFR